MPGEASQCYIPVPILVAHQFGKVKGTLRYLIEFLGMSTVSLFTEFGLLEEILRTSVYSLKYFSQKSR